MKHVQNKYELIPKRSSKKKQAKQYLTKAMEQLDRPLQLSVRNIIQQLEQQQQQN